MGLAHGVRFSRFPALTALGRVQAPILDLFDVTALCGGRNRVCGEHGVNVTGQLDKHCLAMRIEVDKQRIIGGTSNQWTVSAPAQAEAVVDVAAGCMNGVGTAIPARPSGRPVAVFAGAVRDCARYLPAVLRNLDRLSTAYSDVRFVFAVSDSRDQSRQILEDWLSAGRSGEVLDLGRLEADIPQRTRRIAYARNACLDWVRGQSKHFDHLVVVDMDNVLATPISLKNFESAMEWLDAAPSRAAVSANALPRYYDVWALRHETWCAYDCWHVVWERGRSVAFETSKMCEIISRQIEIPRELAPIPVRSAFGGLAIYKRRFLGDAKYVGCDTLGREVAEHVAFNEQISGAGGELFIFPSLTLQAPPEHLYRPSEFRLWWRIRMLWHRLAEAISPPWISLLGYGRW